jgi:hypothetical protein
MTTSYGYDCFKYNSNPLNIESINDEQSHYIDYIHKIAKKHKYLLKEDLKIDININGFNKLINIILKELPTIKKIIKSEKQYFECFIRESDSISKIFKKIIKDLENIYKSRYNLCINKEKCTRYECCAFIHDNDIESIYNPYKDLQSACNKFMENKKIWNASIIMKYIQRLSCNVWYLYSRKKVGKDIMQNNLNF